MRGVLCRLKKNSSSSEEEDKNIFKEDRIKCPVGVLQPKKKKKSYVDAGDLENTLDNRKWTRVWGAGQAHGGGSGEAEPRSH